MAEPTITSTLAIQTLDALKRELSRLSSFTSELGAAKVVAEESQKIASGMITLVEQMLGANETSLNERQHELSRLATEWSEHWREQAAGSLSLLESAASKLSNAGDVPQQALGLMQAALVQLNEDQVGHLQMMLKQQRADSRSQLEVLEQRIAEWLAPLATDQAELSSTLHAASAGFIDATQIQRTALDELVSVARRFDELRASIPMLVEQVESSVTSEAVKLLVAELKNSHRRADSIAESSKSLEAAVEQFRAFASRAEDQGAVHASKHLEAHAADRDGLAGLSKYVSAQSSEFVTRLDAIFSEVEKGRAELAGTIMSGQRRLEPPIQEIGKMVQRLMNGELPEIGRVTQKISGDVSALLPTLSAELASMRKEQAEFREMLAKQSQDLVNQGYELAKQNSLLEKIDKKGWFTR